MPNAIIPKTNATTGSSIAPSAAVLAFGEVASNKFTGDLFLKKEDGTVINVVTSKAGTATPLGDGTAAVGTSLLYARQDHVHPVSPLSVAKAGDTMTGALTVNAAATSAPLLTLQNTGPFNTNDILRVQNQGDGNTINVHKGKKLASITITNGGLGYTNPPLVSFGMNPLFGNSVNPAVTFTIGGGGNSVVGATITNPGFLPDGASLVYDVMVASGSGFTFTYTLEDAYEYSFNVSQLGHVGIGVLASGSACLHVDSSGIRFASDGSTQTAAANPSSVSPLMDGTASVGASLLYARQDHVHPTDTTRMAASLRGAANGVCPLNASSQIDSTYLPSYVDDVIEVTTLPGTGETGKIYVRTSDNTTHRWSGSVWVQITSGGTPSGSATGDLSGSYPNPTVAKIQGRTVASTAPTTSGQALVWNQTTTQYEPTVVIRDGDTITGGTY